MAAHGGGAMTERINRLLGFGAMVACTGAVTAAVGWAMFIGFVVGVITTMGAAVVVASGTHDGDG
jgi:hypothetical protein